MKTMLALSGQKRLRICGWIAACAMAAATAGAQAPAPRIQSEITNELSPLKGSLHPLAQAQFDAGRMPSDTRLNGISIVFNRSAAQQADLDALTAAQQDPASPLFHKWITPDQFAARFGMAQADLDAVQSWLQQQGFTIESVARSRNLIRFSGTVGQVELAFQTQMHYYKVNGVEHFAPSTAVSLPRAIAPVIAAVRNLNDFRPQPMLRLKAPQPSGTKANYTSGQTGNHYLTPKDVATIYDINTAYNASYTGAGQSIAVVGQSEIELSDIENFQTAAGLTVKDPTLVLVPGSGTPAVSVGDESESDIDLEYSGAIAKGATIYLVYVGGSSNYSVWDSVQYAIDTQIAPIITMSYGGCETAMSLSEYTTLEGWLQQGASQGQSIIASSGDSGSTACYGLTGTTLTTPQLEGLSVNYPASSAYVTALGGTEFPLADVASTNTTYWEAATGTNDVVDSALSYIPEQAWNDDSSTNTTDPISAGGGGISTFTPRPSWQTNVPGIPTGTFRMVPDISLDSSADNAGYLYCSSDTSTQVTGSCTPGNGFRDVNNTYLTVAGGTSFAAPIFAGMLAIINQKDGYNTGQGLANPMLYTLASNATTYAAVFHDITSGSIACSAGSAYCSASGESGYSATTGYDLATGLGSFDLGLLANAWTANSAPLIGTTTSISAQNSSPAVNTSDTFTITVAQASGTTAPTGTVTLQIDGGGSGAYGTGTTTTVNLGSDGTATFPYAFTTPGIHQIIAQYPSGSTFASSAGDVSITVTGTSTGSGTFKLAGTNVTVSRGSSAASTITVTPASGYMGTVYLTFDTSNDTALTNLCYEFTTMASNGIDGSVTVSSASAVTTQLTFDTNASDCVAAAATKGNPHAMHRMGGVKTSKNNPINPAPAAIAFAGLLLAGFLGRSSRKFRNLAGLIALLAVGFAVSACGGGGSGTTAPTNPPKGTYTITLTGQDSNTATITASTTFTLTID
jgi:subtilase family serine protease